MSFIYHYSAHDFKTGSFHDGITACNTKILTGEDYNELKRGIVHSEIIKDVHIVSLTYLGKDKSG